MTLTYTAHGPDEKLFFFSFLFFVTAAEYHSYLLDIFTPPSIFPVIKCWLSGSQQLWLAVSLLKASALYTKHIV